MPVTLETELGLNDFRFFEMCDQGIVIFDGNSRVVLKSPLAFDNSCNSNDYHLFFLSKKNVNENDIFVVHDQANKKRLGWIFPVNALSSNNHDYYDNPHFLKYAYVGAKKAIDECGDHVYTRKADANDGVLEFSDIFDDATVLLVLYKEHVPAGLENNYELLTPSLFKHGYVSLKSGNPNDIELLIEAPEERKLNIQFVSQDVDNYKIIGEILDRSIAYEKRAIFKFFFMYQIFELLIDNIYKIEQRAVTKELIEAQGDSGKTKEVISKIQEFLSEKKRINLLFGEYSSVKGQLVELKHYCNDLLTILGKEEGGEAQDCFYKIRNFIFHQYRDFPREGEDCLSNIVAEVINILPELLSTFKVPNNGQRNL